MNDEDFHHMMAAQDKKFFNTFSDQVFLFNELDTSYTDTCSMALLGRTSGEHEGRRYSEY